MPPCATPLTRAPGGEPLENNEAQQQDHLPNLLFRAAALGKESLLARFQLNDEGRFIQYPMYTRASVNVFCFLKVLSVK